MATMDRVARGRFGSANVEVPARPTSFEFAIVRWVFRNGLRPSGPSVSVGRLSVVVQEPSRVEDLAKADDKRASISGACGDVWQSVGQIQGKARYFGRIWEKRGSKSIYMTRSLLIRVAEGGYGTQN